MDQELLDKVLEQLKSDIRSKDYTAIDELLRACPEDSLRAFLSEEV